MGRVCLVLAALIGTPFVMIGGAGCAHLQKGVGASGSFSLGALSSDGRMMHRAVQARTYRLGAGDGLGRAMQAQYQVLSSSAVSPVFPIGAMALQP